VPFADIAIMAPILARGLGTPMLASGPAAVAAVAVLRGFGGSAEVLAGPPGAAATEAAAQRVLQGHGGRGGGGAAAEAARQTGCAATSPRAGRRGQPWRRGWRRQHQHAARRGDGRGRRG
jgi:hypothetical protein